VAEPVQSLRPRQQQAALVEDLQLRVPAGASFAQNVRLFSLGKKPINSRCIESHLARN
jgi:hypothetical protein